LSAARAVLFWLTLMKPVVEKHADPAVKAKLTTGEDNDVNNEIVWKAG